jgi:DeoR family glycerol-3-phosphate regulon repressor
MTRLARQRRLLAMLDESGQLLVAQAAVALAVSDDTIRRDLTDLDARGLLHKTHGGAVARDMGGMDRTTRAQLLTGEKRRIARAAAAALPPGLTLMLDAGSTLLAFAEALAVPATIITNSLDIAQRLDRRNDIRLILAGGAWDARQRLFAGDAARATLARYRADIVLLGACAIDAGGVTATEEQDGDIKRTMLAMADTAWLLADHLKFGRREPHAVAGLDRFARLYTDRTPPEVGIARDRLFIASQEVPAL